MLLRLRYATLEPASVLLGEAGFRAVLPKELLKGESLA